MKPLEKGQLKNWKEYLDFEIENGSHARVMVLFERCMIACALYEEFWLKVRLLNRASHHGELYIIVLTGMTRGAAGEHWELIS